MAKQISVMVSILLMMVEIHCRAAAWVPPKGMIFSVLARDKDVIASTCEGIYKADKSTKQWKKLPIPDSMPLGGQLAEQPKTLRSILYVGSELSPCWPAGVKGKTHGLYRWTDSSRKWELVSKAYDFQEAFFHPNGTIYAIVMKTFKSKDVKGVYWHDEKTQEIIRWLILMSKDKGKSWRDITGKIPVGANLYGIRQDPDHPNLICLGGNLIRGYTYYADDESYDWKSEREWDWMARHETDESFFTRNMATTTVAHVLTPTLSNYFTKGAPEIVPSHAFDIVPEKTVYDFAKSGPKVIRVAITFLCDEKVTLTDFPHSADMWHVKVIGPDGKRIATRAASAIDNVNGDKERAAKASKMRNSQPLAAFEIDPAHPYRRMIDLNKIYKFRKTGSYRVQLGYYSMDVAERDKGHWPGHFTGSVFTVRVK